MSDQLHSNGFKRFAVEDYSEEVGVDRVVGFVLEGETYECLPYPPGEAWEGLSDDTLGFSTIVRFIASSLASPEDEARFRSQISSKEQGKVIPIQILRDITMHLIGEYSQRPTQRPTASSGGPAATGPFSTDTSQFEGLTSMPSPSEGH